MPATDAASRLGDARGDERRHGQSEGEGQQDCEKTHVLTCEQEGCRGRPRTCRTDHDDSLR